MMHVAILAGGKGTRLWPLSNGGRPKQFLPLPYDETLLEQAYARARLLAPEERIWIVTLASQVRETRRLLPRFDPSRIIAEPEGKSTAPAVALATLAIEARAGKPVTVLMLPADHYVPEKRKFVAAVRKGMKRAAEGVSLVTFGLPVSAPRTDFGYIETRNKSGGISKVARFIEKPPLAKAKTFSKSGRYFWNSGMFGWRSDFFRSEMSRHASGILGPLAALRRSDRSGAALRRAYKKLPPISIDYALMEKSRKVEMAAARFRWSDVGTWAAVAEALAAPKTGNAVIGKGKVVGGRGNLVRAPHKPVVLFGVDGLAVIDTPGATLVTTLEKSRDLKKLLKIL